MCRGKLVFAQLMDHLPLRCIRFAESWRVMQANTKSKRFPVSITFFAWPSHN